jgi:hypothetical protein
MYRINYQQQLSYFERTDIIHKTLPAFRKTHLRDTALTRQINSWLSDIGFDKLVGAGIPNLIKAFDLIGHN